jgi:hypothetical protein
VSRHGERENEPIFASAAAPTPHGKEPNVQSAESHVLERIERATTAGPGAENVECVITHEFSNIGTVYVRRAPENTTLLAIAFDFQARYCSITLCGEVFEHATPPIRGECGSSYRVEKVAKQRGLPHPQLVFGVLRYDEDQRIQGMLDLIASAAAVAEPPSDSIPSLLIGVSEIAAAVAPARRALASDSNDAEHDALHELAETLDGWLSLAAKGARPATTVSDPRLIAAMRLGELLLDAAERRGASAAERQAFIRSFAASDLDGLARRLIEHT